MLPEIATGRTTPEGGQCFVPNVQAIRDDSDSRRELVDTVVQGMTRSTGEPRIRNDMDSGQSLLVNGVVRSEQSISQVRPSSLCDVMSPVIKLRPKQSGSSLPSHSRALCLRKISACFATASAKI